jgi:3-oxoacyl-[acyl-carrier protein] reductase
MPEEMQHAVITGGTGSLGQAIAAALQEPGWMISALGSKDLDVTNESAVFRYFNDQSVDLLVCAAGIIRDAPLIRLSEKAWNDVWDVNFMGTVSCVNAVLPAMLAKGAGHIIFLSSFSALHPPVGQTAYAAAKAALLGLVSDLAARHGPSNIRINAILPGFLETTMTSSVSEERRSKILKSHTLGRLNTCFQAAKFIRFLHHEMSHTSGQIFQLDSRLNN